MLITIIIGTNYAFLDISSFFIATILGQIYAYIKNKNNCPCNISFLVILLLFSFIFFTFFPPHIGLFKDPVTNLIWNKLKNQYFWFFDYFK